MRKLSFLLLTTSIVLIGCSRRYECNCAYKQISYQVNDAGDTVQVNTDTTYLSYISYTSKKLANEECDERGRSLMIDSLKVEADCKVSKYKP